MRSSARSAVSVDARDSLQPVDHAGRAAMAREGMLQLVVVVEAFWPNAGCTQPVTQTTRGGPITRRGTLPPPTPPSSPMRHPLAHCGSPPRLRPRTRTKTQGWPGSGVRTPTPPPTLPPNPSTPCLQARARDGRAGGGGQSPSPGVWATGEGPPNPTPWAAQPPMHIGAGRRSFRRTPSRAAWLTVLGRAPQAASFTGSRASGCVVG